jgi:hypothetical protein
MPLQNSISSSSKTIDIIVKSASDIQNKVLVSNRRYYIDTTEEIKDIIVPAGGLTLVGAGFNITKIKTTEANATIFKSPVEGSGNLTLIGLEISNTGIGSKTFNLKDETNNFEVSFKSVNFQSNVSLGKIDGYRQGTADDIGFYGVQDGLIFEGAWNGFKIISSNLFGFASTGTLFKKGLTTTFLNRFFVNANLSLPTGAILTNFDSSVFLQKELFQLNSCQIKVNGQIDSSLANTIIPNLSANNEKCLWIGNIGLPDTALENFVDTNVSGNYQIDWLQDTYNLVLTSNTTFTERNLPASGKNTQEILLYVTGNFIPTFPAAWLLNIVGTYKGSDVNEIRIKFIKNGLYFMKISNSLSVYPKPSLQNLVPTSLLPSNTAQLTINGSFFTPATVVTIKNQVINSVEFVNQGKLILSVTTSPLEENVDIIISNGTTVVFSGILPINLGVVYIPSEADWTVTTGTPNLSDNGEIKLTTFGLRIGAKYNIPVDYTSNFSIRFRLKTSPLGVKSTSYPGIDTFTLRNFSNNGAKVFTTIYRDATSSGGRYYVNGALPVTMGNLVTYISTSVLHEFRYINGTMVFYHNNALQNVPQFSSLVLTENMYIEFDLQYFDIVDIKYIELP